MGMLLEKQILNATLNASRETNNLLAQLVVEQKRTNELLLALVSRPGGEHPYSAGGYTPAPGR